MMETCVAHVLARVALELVTRAVSGSANARAWWARRIELTSVVDSSKRAAEAAHLARVMGLSAYDGSAYHGHPWTVWAMVMGGEVGLDVAALACECAAALALEALVRRETRDEGRVRFVNAVYLLHPLRLLSTLARSTSAATRAATYWSAYAATGGRAAASGVALALAVQMHPHAIALAPAMIAASIHSRVGERASVSVGKFLFGFAACAFASFIAMGDYFAKWWRAAVVFSVMSEDQTPNLGLHWYVFTTMFDQFRLFYVVALNVIPLALSAAATIRFKDRPLVAITVSLTAIAICAPYPTVADVLTYMSLLPVIASSDEGNPLAYMKHGAWIAGGFMYVALLSPLTWYMWIHTRVANANFYFAITLVHAVTQIILLNQVINSVIMFGKSRRHVKEE